MYLYIYIYIYIYIRTVKRQGDRFRGERLHQKSRKAHPLEKGVYMCLCVSLYIYIYIYRERERDRQKDITCEIRKSQKRTKKLVIGKCH